LDVMELLDIADSSMKVVALLQRFRQAGQSMYRCDQTTCGLHGFQWLWVAARGSCGGEAACGAIPKIQHIIARTLSGDVDSASTGPEQSSRNDIAHEAMKGLKRLFKAAEIQGKVAQETVKLLKDLSKGKRTGSVTSGDRTSDHPSDRAVTVRSDTQEHVPYNTEAPTESSPTEIAISAIAEGQKERSDTGEIPAAKIGRQSSNKENQRSEPYGESVHAPDVGMEGRKLTLSREPRSEPRRPAKPQLNRASRVTAAVPGTNLQTVNARATIANGNPTQSKMRRLPPVQPEKYRSVFSLSNFASEVPSRKMIFLNRKNLAVWRHIFPERGSKDKRVEIEWVAFERVMQSSPLDFRMEKLSGNGTARTFVRIDPERGQESITLHRPHGPMIPVPYLRNWQRRFRRSLRMEPEDFIGPE